MTLAERKTAIFMSGSPYKVITDEGNFLHCSHCHREFAVFGSAEDPDKRVYFCPICGAQRVMIFDRGASDE